MSITESIRYGATELKRVYNRNLGMALAISVGVHVLLIGLYVFGINIGKADEDKAGNAVNKMKLVNIAPPPQQQDAPPPPPPPMIPPELMTGGGGGGGVASRAGNPVPIPDALVAPDIKEFAATTELSVATPEGGDGTGFGPMGDGEGLGAPVDLGGNVEFKEKETEPDPDEFIADATEPYIDLSDVQKRVEYPEIAKRNGIEGKVVVRVLVDKTGKPIRTRVDEGNSLLQSAAVNAIMASTFTPGVQNGTPIKAWVSIPVVFKLQDN